MDATLESEIIARETALLDAVASAVTVTLEGSYLGVVVDGRYRYLRVWKRVGGAWRVIAGSVVAIPAPS
jgi:hypothetical protein